MIPRKFEPLLFALLLSGMMSLLVAGISTARTTGLAPDFIALWLMAWLTAWPVAFPAVLVLAPLTRKLVARLIRDEHARGTEPEDHSPERSGPKGPRCGSPAGLPAYPTPARLRRVLCLHKTGSEESARFDIDASPRLMRTYLYAFPLAGLVPVGRLNGDSRAKQRVLFSSFV